MRSIRELNWTYGRIHLPPIGQSVTFNHPSFFATNTSDLPKSAEVIKNWKLAVFNQQFDPENEEYEKI